MITLELWNLTFDQKLWYELKKLIRIEVAYSRKGNPVRVGDGHAAVIGDETCQIHCPES